MPFWLGPPLPKIMGVYWPFAQASSSASLPSLPAFFTNTEEPKTPATSTYDNTEIVEFPEGFDEETLMPKKIVIHRHAKIGSL